MMLSEIPKDYRAARRAFIAACESVGVDAIARVQPGKAGDGKPLFMDSAALGPRLATKAVLAVANSTAGTMTLINLLRAGPLRPGEERLVLVHALDPGAFAGSGGDAAWAAAMLGAVAAEDLSKVTDLTVMDLTGGNLKPALAAALPGAKITITALPAPAL